MKLGVRIGLGAGHIVLDRDPAAPPPKGHIPQFSAHICCGEMVAGRNKTPFLCPRGRVALSFGRVAQSDRTTASCGPFT